MDNLLIGFGGGLLVALVALGTWRLARGSRRRAQAPAVTHESFITSMRAVGDLSVFRIMTKEVITASEHWLGEFGKKYLNWLLSAQRITLIIEFDVDFRYDLTDPAFSISQRGPGDFQLKLPPCHHEVLIRDMRIHSEDKTELLPWLMPDLLNRFLTGGFSVEAKNKLITETRDQASRFAADLVQRTTSEAQRSAAQTLSMLAQGLGATKVDFDFAVARDFQPRVDTTALERVMADPEQIRGEGF